MDFKHITLSISEEHDRKFVELAQREYTDKSKLLRKWIDEHYGSKEGKR